MRLLPAFIALILAAPASAETRDFTVTFFDKVRLEGNMAVTVTSGGSPAVHADGDQRSIDQLKVEVRGNTLLIGVDRTNWTGTSMSQPRGNARLSVTVPAVLGASLNGSGTLKIDRVRGETVQLGLGGSGELVVDALDSDRLSLALVGSGAMRVSGHSKDAQISVQGSGQIYGDALTVGNANVILGGPGAVTLIATDTAKIDARGSGSVHIGGGPACTVKNEGSGEAYCGR